MSAARRPSLTTRVELAPTVNLELGGKEALTALAAVHEARAALKALSDPALDPLLEALEVHERALGVAIGAERARAFLRRRARRKKAGRSDV